MIIPFIVNPDLGICLFHNINFCLEFLPQAREKARKNCWNKFSTLSFGPSRVFLYCAGVSDSNYTDFFPERGSGQRGFTVGWFFIFCFFVGMGVCRVVPSHLWLLEGLVFCFWLFFYLYWGGEIGLFSSGLCWMSGMRLGRVFFS